MSKEEKAYKEIISVVNKYKDICIYDVKDMEDKAKYHLFGCELRDKYGLIVDPIIIRSVEYVKVDDFRFIGMYGKKYNRTISWEDDNKQPNDELLLYIGFSTGAYIFGEDYPTQLFADFWNELKGYGPKYIDTTNKGLYFAMDNAGKVSNEFKNIFKRYQERNVKESKQRKIDKLQEELKKLGQNNNG